jgi:hypothetical protein
MAERYFAEALGYPEERIRRLRVAEAAIRAGNAPSPIDRLAVCAFLDPRPDGAEAGDLRVRAQVANINVRLRFAETEDDGAEPCQGVFGAPVDLSGRTRPSRISHLEVSGDRKRITATAVLEPQWVGRLTPTTRHLAALPPHPLQAAEALLIAAQVCQVLVYQHDQIDRHESENLWMRRIELRMNTGEPLWPGEPTRLNGAIDRARDVPLGGQVFRVFRVSGGSHHFTCEADVAHALPAIATAGSKP